MYPAGRAAEVRERRDRLAVPPTPSRNCWRQAPINLELGRSRLLGPTKWTYYYLYVMLDIFSRYVVGWLIAERQYGTLAELLIAEACAKQRSARPTHDPCR